jgi:sugar (pentulose or hexulose) kinase
MKTKSTAQLPVIAILDIGKTNKKLFLFDRQYNIVFEKNEVFEEIIDEDGDSAEDIRKLSDWVINTLKLALRDTKFEVKAINFATYGASFVLTDENGLPVAPLYNYLKPFPLDLSHRFYQQYGGQADIARQTASPILGNLNSGMQLYRLKYQKGEIFEKIKYALHLPQYISYLVTKRFLSEVTSIGCHTQLWDFERHDYHQWVKNEKIDELLAPISLSNQAFEVIFEGKKLRVGIGLHDSSAALIPYLRLANEPFVLISTGTWCISLNPFNDIALTFEELSQDCLCFMSYEGKSIKASRIFAGNEHHLQVNRIAKHFACASDFYKEIRFDVEIIIVLRKRNAEMQFANQNSSVNLSKESGFATRNLVDFEDEIVAYHQLMLDIVNQQVVSTKLIIANTDEQRKVKRIYVDGGFSKNTIYLYLLAMFFPKMQVFAASVAQSTAMGAALAIHSFWNDESLRSDLIDCQCIENLDKHTKEIHR